MNLAEIQSAARSIIVDVTAGVESGLIRSIQRAQRELEFKTFCPDQVVREIFRYSLLGTNSGSFYVDFASFAGASYDFIRLVVPPFLLDTPSASIAPVAKPLLRMEAAEWNQQYADAQGILVGVPNLRGSPKYWVLTDDRVYFYPVADDQGPYAGLYHISVQFYRHLTPLAAASDTNWFTEHEECAEYIIFRAAEDGLRLIRDPLFATYRQLAMERKVEAQRAARRSGWVLDDFIDVKPAARIGSIRP